MIKQVKDKLVTALKNFGSKAMSFAKAPKIKVQKDIQNMILTTMVVTGLAILAGSIKIIFTDLSGSDMGFSEVLLGSRTGEAISLGIGLSLIHYLLIGCTLLLSGMTFFLRNSSLLSSLQQIVIEQVQKVKIKNYLKKPTKITKSIRSIKIKKPTNPAIKFRQATKSIRAIKIKKDTKPAIKLKQAIPKIKLKKAPSAQNSIGLKTRIVNATSRIFQWANVYTTQKRKQTIIISVIAVSAILNVFFLTTISAQFFVKNDIYSYGTVQVQTQTAGLRVYTDSSCTVRVSSLPWGDISPGKSVSNIVYIKNEGTVPLILTLNTIEWNPADAPDYISLNWNYNGQPIEPDQVRLVRLTLSVSQNINGIDSFNFQILINGES